MSVASQVRMGIFDFRYAFDIVDSLESSGFVLEHGKLKGASMTAP